MPAASGMTVRAKETSLGIVTERKGRPPKWRAVRDRTERTTCARRPGPRDQRALPLRPIQKPTLSPIAPPARAAAARAGRLPPCSKAKAVAKERAAPAGTNNPVTKEVSRKAVTKVSQGPWRATWTRKSVTDGKRREGVGRADQGLSLPLARQFRTRTSRMSSSVLPRRSGPAETTANESS